MAKKVKRASKAKTVKVFYGTNDFAGTFTGKTVAEVYDGTQGILNLPSSSEMTVLVNGKSAEFDKRVKAGDEVEFIKVSGTKGN
jgi:molybdopterin converting factor small subunit